MKLDFYLKMLKGYILAYLRANKVSIVIAIDNAIRADALDPFLEGVEKLPDNSLFQRFVKWLLVKVIKKNLDPIKDLIEKYDDLGAQYIVNKLIEVLENA